MARYYITDPRYYITDPSGEPIEVDITTWSKWFENIDNRIVGKDYLPGNILVSTVFFGIDNYADHRGLNLWETMIFGGQYDGYEVRYSSLLDARIGHSEALSLVYGTMPYVDPEDQLFEERMI